jgi:hypothetical protein
LRTGLEKMIEQQRNESRGDPEREAKAWLHKLTEVDRARSAPSSRHGRHAEVGGSVLRRPRGGHVKNDFLRFTGSSAGPQKRKRDGPRLAGVVCLSQRGGASYLRAAGEELYRLTSQIELLTPDGTLALFVFLDGPELVEEG